MKTPTTAALPATMRELRSLVTAGGQLELTLAQVPVPAPGEHEVVVRVQGAPINPSDLGLLLAGADVSQATSAGTDDEPVLTAPIAPRVLAGLQGRIGQALTVGNEGCGVVVAAGGSPEAQALIGKMVGLAGGGTYAQYRTVAAAFCIALPDGTSARDGASCFVNPLTALGMVETMRLEQHTALVHTAAASNLGQMLVRVCLEDSVPLVNVVRRPEQAALLRDSGATHVVDSSAESFRADLTAAIADTGATLAFDAIGGGRLGSTILSCMEAAISGTNAGYNRYGSAVHKQLYIYGGLDPSPTELSRNFGMAWGVAGWLLPPFLGRVGLEALVRMRDRVVAGLTTTFASNYASELSLAAALQPAAVQAYARMATGEKYLIRPDL